MSIIQKKYLKDENGNTFSPMTSYDSIYVGGGVSLQNYLDGGTWNKLSLNSPFKTRENNPFYDLSFLKVGRIVFITGQIGATEQINNGNREVVVLPIRARPNKEIQFIHSHGSGYITVSGKMVFAFESTMPVETYTQIRSFSFVTNT